MTSRCILSLILLSFAGCVTPLERQQGANESDHLFVWATDADSVDLNFLAVMDANPHSARYGEVLTTLPVPTRGRTRGHHTEHRMPEDQHLFANDFGTGMTYVFDVRDALAPVLSDSFVTAGPLASPHSFERLPNGNVLATFQNEGPGNALPGGLAELDRRGQVVRWSRAGGSNPSVRPYSLAIVPSFNRVVTGSADMRGDVGSHVIQIWQLEDLTLVETLHLPMEWGEAAEPRVLSDGETVLVSTFGCKLIRVDGLGTGAPSPSLVHDFGGSGCALPVVVDGLWIQAVPDIPGLVALDVTEEDRVREVSRMALPEGHWPHWITLAPSQRRIAISGYAGTRHRVIMVDVDPASGRMSVDSAFSSRGVAGPGYHLTGRTGRTERQGQRTPMVLCLRFRHVAPEALSSNRWQPQALGAWLIPPVLRSTLDRHKTVDPERVVPPMNLKIVRTGSIATPCL